MSAKIKKSYVYKITDTTTGKFYIGKTSLTKPINRFRNHLSKADRIKRGDNPNIQSKLYRAINSHSPENFIFEIIATFNSEDEAYKAEFELINEFDTINNGLNLQPGGWGNKIDNPGLKGEKNGMFGRTQELNPFFGKKHSAETKRKIVEGKTKLSLEEISKLKTMINNNVPVKEIKLRFNVGDVYISKIKGGDRFSWVEPQIINGRRKVLTDDDIFLIRDEWNTCKHIKTMSDFYRDFIIEKYDKSFGTICSIIQNKSFKHLLTKEELSEPINKRKYHRKK